MTAKQIILRVYVPTTTIWGACWGKLKSIDILTKMRVASIVGILAIFSGVAMRLFVPGAKDLVIHDKWVGIYLGSWAIWALSQITYWYFKGKISGIIATEKRMAGLLRPMEEELPKWISTNEPR